MVSLYCIWDMEKINSSKEEIDLFFWNSYDPMMPNISCESVYTRVFMFVLMLRRIRTTRHIKVPKG